VSVSLSVAHDRSGRVARELRRRRIRLEGKRETRETLTELFSKLPTQSVNGGVE
jgi:hypothetical protein